MPTVYIAGPMRGIESYNFPAFDDARDRFKAASWKVISPADIDRAHDIHEDSVLEFTPATARVFAQRDAHAIISQMKAEDGDALALLPGWEDSTGATAELFLARWVGLKVLDARTLGPFRENDDHEHISNCTYWMRVAMENFILGRS